MHFLSVLARRLPNYLKNIYVVTLLVFLVWMLLFDRNDIVSQVKLRSKLDKLREDREYYKIENGKNREALRSLVTDTANLERFARERYLMKKEGEELFVIVEED